MRILAVSAHPDDETLGCGGTLLRHRAEGDELSWLVVTRAHAPAWTDEVIQKKCAEVERVAAAYGMQQTFALGIPSGTADAVPQGDLIARIREAVLSARPEIVYVVHRGDVHSDHGAVFESTLRVLKAFYMRQLGVRAVLSYETLSSTETGVPGAAFVPTTFKDITSFIDQKLSIMSMYATEAQPDPMPRGASAIRALARYRGATVGVDYAEAFMLIREIQ